MRNPARSRVACPLDIRKCAFLPQLKVKCVASIPCETLSPVPRKAVAPARLGTGSGVWRKQVSARLSEKSDRPSAFLGCTIQRGHARGSEAIGQTPEFEMAACLERRQFGCDLEACRMISGNRRFRRKSEFHPMSASEQFLGHDREAAALRTIDRSSMQTEVAARYWQSQRHALLR